ncbi:TonB-dependent receptor domain-containing protein [Helicobacter ibis]|uniref:TonB-dependent receptor n=1 Tax=Helicobacter ibis TaxID=2962633 RepID=A0ABT4VFC2_9HELI|nr:TonB-dependent receptor [Helicobacter ibis]MDA3969396.1 TonB-dependent receptor [Helicobacter ibis]
MEMKKLVVCVSLAGILSANVYANEYRLDTSVISATGFEQDVKDAPASISIITKEDLENRPVADIADAIKDVPGVDVSVSKLGTYSFNIRGYGSNYVLVLVDGKRQNSVRGFQGNGFGEADNAYLPPLAMIERIEIIKGPASTLYGGDAVGGVVNIITKKNPSEVTGTISFDTKFQQHPDLYGNYKGINSYLAFPLLKDTLSLSLRGQYKTREKSNLKWPTQTDLSNPNTAYPSHSPGAFDMGNIGTRLNWTINEQNNMYFDAEHYFQKTATNNTSGKSVAVNKKYRKNNLLLNHDGYYHFGTLNTYLQSQTTSEVGSSSIAGNGAVSKGARLDSEVYIAESKAIIPISMGNLGGMSLSAGAQFMYENFVTFASSAGALQGKDQDQTTISPYAEAEYYITDSLILTGGLRYAKSDLFDGEFIPRGYLVYHLTDNITLKGGVAKGYKTPEAKVLTSGEYSLGYYGNPNLKPESSINYELGTIFDFNHYGNVSITAFQTEFRDEISSEMYDYQAMLPNGAECSVDTGCYYSVNRGRNEALGVEVALTSGEYKGFSANVSYTFLDKKYKDGIKNVLGGDRVENAPRHTAILKLNYTSGKLSSYIKATGRYDTLAKSKGGGNRPILGLDKYKDFYVVDLGMSYKLSKSSSISLAINNLFDRDFFVPHEYLNNGNVAYVNSYKDYYEGRNMWINYKFEF